MWVLALIFDSLLLVRKEMQVYLNIYIRRGGVIITDEMDYWTTHSLCYLMYCYVFFEMWGGCLGKTGGGGIITSNEWTTHSTLLSTQKVHVRRLPWGDWRCAICGSLSWEEAYSASLLPRLTHPALPCSTEYYNVVQWTTVLVMIGWCLYRSN